MLTTFHSKKTNKINTKHHKKGLNIKVIYSLLVIITLVPFLIISYIYKPQLASGTALTAPVMYLKFDEGYGEIAYDNSGNSNNGNLGESQTCPGAANCPTITSSGKFVRSLDFDGTADTLAVADSASLSFGNGTTDSPFTVSAWIYMDDATSFQIVSKMAASGILANLEWAFATGTTDKLALQLYDDNYTKYIGTVGLNAVTEYESTWIYVAATYDGSSSANGIKLYMNGVEMPSAPYSGGAYVALSNTAVSVRVGSVFPSDATYKRFANGKIDEVKIYNYELTEAQIKTDRNKGNDLSFGVFSTDSTGNIPDNSRNREYCVPGDVTTCDSPVGEWLFDEGTLAVAYDTSGNGNNGAITSSGWVPGKNGGGIAVYRSPSDGSDKSTVTDPVSGILDFDNTQDYTISAWIKATNLEADIFPIYKGAADANTAGYQMRIDSSDGFAYCLYTDGNGTGTEYIGSTTIVNNNKWHFINCVMDRDGAEIGLAGLNVFVDGTLSATDATLTESSGVTALDLIIGENVVQREFDGAIDQVRIYNYARTSAQIAWEYSKGEPIAHYKFDECTGTVAYNSARTFNDSAPGGDGTIEPGDTSGSNDSVGSCVSGNTDEMRYNGATGKINASLDFDGTNDYVNAGDSYAITNESVASSMWFYMTAYPDSRKSYQFGRRAATTADYMWGLNPDGSAFYCHSNGGWRCLTGPSGVIGLNTWTHMAVSFNGLTNTAVIYIDGKIYDSGALVNGLALNANQTFRLGQSLSSDSDYYTGKLDDVRIYNYALNSQQVKSVMNDGIVNFR